jgi:hypothetical protein
MKRISFKGVVIGSIADVVSTHIVVIPLMMYFLFSLGWWQSSDHAAGSVTEILLGNTAFAVLVQHLGRTRLCVGRLYFGADRKTRRSPERSALIGPFRRCRGVLRDQRKRGRSSMALSRFPAAKPRAGGPRRLPARAATCAARLIKQGRKQLARMNEVICGIGTNQNPGCHLTLAG